MATKRTTFTLDKELAEKARQMNINLSAAARAGVREAVRAALVRADRDAYLQNPEQPDPFWEGAEAWGEE